MFLFVARPLVGFLTSTAVRVFAGAFGFLARSPFGFLTCALSLLARGCHERTTLLQLGPCVERLAHEGRQRGVGPRQRERREVGIPRNQLHQRVEMQCLREARGRNPLLLLRLTQPQPFAFRLHAHA